MSIQSFNFQFFCIQDSITNLLLLLLNPLKQRSFACGFYFFLFYNLELKEHKEKKRKKKRKENIKGKEFIFSMTCCFSLLLLLFSFVFLSSYPLFLISISNRCQSILMKHGDFFSSSCSGYGGGLIFYFVCGFVCDCELWLKWWFGGCVSGCFVFDFVYGFDFGCGFGCRSGLWLWLSWAVLWL